MPHDATRYDMQIGSQSFVLFAQLTDRYAVPRITITHGDDPDDLAEPHFVLVGNDSACGHYIANAFCGYHEFTGQARHFIQRYISAIVYHLCDPELPKPESSLILA